MKYETLRVYGKAERIGYWPTEEELDQLTWKQRAHATRECQWEVVYKDYTFLDGKLLHTTDGSEDFTTSRACNYLAYRWIYGWFGNYNKGGHRRWVEISSIKVAKGTAPRLIRLWAKETFAGPDDIQIR